MIRKKAEHLAALMSSALQHVTGSELAQKDVYNWPHHVSLIAFLREEKQEIATVRCM
jgi:hypothetical protein